MSSQNNNIPEGFKMTELGLLPEEWKVVRLRDNSHFHSLPSGIRFFTETKKYLSTSSIQGSKIESPECLITYNDRPSRANMQPALGTVWFAKMIGTVKVYSFTRRNNHEINEYILSTGFCGILCKDDVDPEYMKFIFLSDFFNNLKDSLCSGTTQRAINSENIGSIQIPLPPLPEQKAIAKVLSAIQKAIEAQDKIIAAARELKKSLMRHLFTYGPVPVAAAATVPLKETEIGPVPAHWEVVNLDSVKATLKGSIVSGPFGSSIGKRFFMPSGVPVIRGNNVTTGRKRFIDEGFVYLTPEKASEFTYCEAIPGDVVFTAAGTIGQVGIVPEDGRFKKYIISNKQMRVRLNMELTFPAYIFYWFTSSIGQEEIICQRRGTSIPVINLSILRSLKLPLPPIPIQKEIVEILSTLDSKIESEESRKAALQALFKTMLHHLMTGKVRVKDMEGP